MRHLPLFLPALALGVALTLLSFAIGGRVTVTYPSIMGCETGCEVVAAGWPVPFVADHPGLSPVDSVGFIEAFVLGIDTVRWGRFAASLAFWTVASLAVLALVPRGHARRGDAHGG